MTRRLMIVSGLMAVCAIQSLRAAEQGAEPSIPTIYAEIQYMQVPEGGEELYLKVEEAWKKIHSTRKELGITQASLLCKVKRTDGPASDYNYTVVHIFDSWAKLENPYQPWDTIQSRLSISAEEKEIFVKTSASRTMLRTELWKLEDVAMLSRWGQSGFDKTIQLGFMKSKKPGQLSLEKDAWKKLWAVACEDGLRWDWHLWSRHLPGGSAHAFDLVAVHFFREGERSKPFPEDWGTKAAQRVFPDQGAGALEKLVQETNEIRDIPITEEWTIVKMVGMDQ